MSKCKAVLDNQKVSQITVKEKPELGKEKIAPGTDKPEPSK